MRLEHYEVEISGDAFTFEFDSEGPKGRIRKMVQFSPFEDKNIFNLGFGDKNLVTRDFDDAAVTDNGDTEKVLSTVAHVTCFPRALSEYGFTPPAAYRFAQGFTAWVSINIIH